MEAQFSRQDKAKRILVIDDQNSMRSYEISVLRSMGFEHVYGAPDGSKAIEALEQSQFDIILCDWDMPKVAGIDVLRHVRSSRLHAAVPFIMITGNVVADQVKLAVEEGVTDYIAKPFTQAQLESRFRKALGI